MDLSPHQSEPPSDFEDDAKRRCSGGTSNSQCHFPNPEYSLHQGVSSTSYPQPPQRQRASAPAAELRRPSAPSHGIDSNSTLAEGIRKARKTFGLHPRAPIEHTEREKLLWPRIRLILREPFSEFWGTLIMVLFGNGSVAQVVLSTGQRDAPGGNGFGSYQSINWGWGLGVMLGLYVAGDSGAYLNPAMTFSNCVYRRLPWRRFPLYFLAQFLGAFVGSGIVYANYISAIDRMEGGHDIRTVPPVKTATAGIFCTYPQEFVTKSSQFFSEFIASAILMFVIYALKDQHNNGVPKDDKWFPLCLFFLVFGIGACFGWETGYAINFARDFAPRLMSYALGYGHEVWSAGGYYFWIPMVVPFLGCLFGGFLYDVFIYTGESPINTPWMGMKWFLRPDNALRSMHNRVKRHEDEGIV